MNFEGRIDGRSHAVQIEGTGSGPLSVILDGQAMAVDACALEGYFLSLLIDGKAYEVTVEPDGEAWRVQVGIDAYSVTFLDPLRSAQGNETGAAGRSGKAEAGGQTAITALMPGKVVRLLVKAGDDVTEGQNLLVVEAMKMENAVPAPCSGRVLELKVETGDTVESGALLALIG